MAATKGRALGTAAALGVAGAGVLVSMALGVPAASAGGSGPNGLQLTPVPAANQKAAGVSPPNVLSPELTESAVARGDIKLDNGTSAVPFYGYDGDGPLHPAAGDTQSTTHNVEATKTEPDKNTYLVLKGQHGADPKYDYGTHFLFQGHELGSPGYITRINLDADEAHRVTLLATSDEAGKALPVFDGSTWDPWAQRLLLTSEEGAEGGVWQSTPDIDAKVQDVSWVFGRGGYEAIQNDSAGNLWVVEDVGGTTVPTAARNPNSFVYRLVPVDRDDLTKGGKLQALQVVSNRTHQPITFQAVDATHPSGGAFTDDRKDIYSYGNTFITHWVTVHDTATDHSGAAFDANGAAKKAGATPFKRPENGQFQPGSGFRDFFFDETGDTNATSTANAEFGGWGAIQWLHQKNPASDDGTLTLFYKSDSAHSSFDNVAFLDRDHVAFVQDQGDGLHSQLNALDSGFLFNVRSDYSKGATPLRFLAEGRDPSATVDSALLGASGTGFQNEGDNEITGIHVSNGDPSTKGILGARTPKTFSKGWRLFYTAQHGDNVTWEIVPKK